MTAGKFVRRRGKMTPHSLSHHLGRPRVHEASGGNTQDLHLSDSLRCVAGVGMAQERTQENPVIRDQQTFHRAASACA